MIPNTPHNCDCTQCRKAHEGWAHNFRLREIAERANENITARVLDAERIASELEVENEALRNRLATLERGAR